MATRFTNPFRPGAGHMPPYLAGRTQETKEFLRLLTQNIIMENLVLTGLRDGKDRVARHLQAVSN